MAEKYDVVIMGSGPAGRAAAVPLAKAGKSVAVTEDYGFGGTCPLRGCEPKKLLADAAFAVAKSRDMIGQGLAGDLSIDWPELMKFNRSFVEPVSDRVEAWLNSEGIDTFLGNSRLTGPRTVICGDDEIEGGKIIVAAGAKPRPIDFPGSDLVQTSDDFLAMPQMPGRIVFVGGGYVSFELAHLARRAGAEVTILEVMDRPLGIFEPELVDMLVSSFEDLGIKILTGRPAHSIKKQGQAFLVRAGKAGEETHEADMVVHGAGRVPAVDGMGLDEAGVDYSPRGINVDEYMQSTSNPDLYAAGDVAATPPPLTPVATMEGKVAAHNIIHGNSLKSDRSLVPSACFTYPPLATVGLREADAQKQGLKFKTVFKNTAGWSEHKRIGLKYAGAKLLIDEANDLLLGAHIFGHRSEEMINILALAMKHNITITSLQEMIWAYPSFAYNLRYLIV